MRATDELEERRERAARNQSLFREVNERIEELQWFPSFVEFVCECGRQECAERVPLRIEEYEEIRSDANRFFVATGHEITEVERIVASKDRYLVVAKLGSGATIAKKLDPRQRGVAT
jgi:hypothetical protein